MTHIKPLLICGLIVCCLTSANRLFAQTEQLTWQPLSPLPDQEGFAGMFAGVSNDVLLAAGGANFPQGYPWEGGRKVWYDTIFVLDKPSGKWRNSEQKLPRPVGYGVSITFDNSLFIVGGESATADTKPACRPEVYSLRWNGKEVTRQDLPSLPRPVAYSCGALLGETIYVAGGISSSTATEALHTFWSLDLSLPRDQQRWIEQKPWPGPARMLAVAAVTEKEFLLFSGAELSAGPEGKPVRKYLTDAYAFEPQQGWRKLADLPRAAVAAPSPALVTAGKAYLFSGDDGLQVGQDPQKHRGFPPEVLSYDFTTDRWTRSKLPAPRVTAPCVFWRGQSITISGEQRPGVRSPQVWSTQPQKDGSP